MNWPQLSPECSQAIADALKDAVACKPKDIFQHVAQRLQARSGLDPDEFEARFEEARRRPRTYVLEERCPAGQDPFAWVTMRYNDDTILSILQQRASELVSDVLHEDASEDTKTFLHRSCVAFPELMYLKDSPEELLAFQTLRALHLGCSGLADIGDHLEDEDPQLSFRCVALTRAFREQLFEPVKTHDRLDALILCCVLRVVGGNAAFQQRYGGGLAAPGAAVQHAIDNAAKALPSFQRLAEPLQELIVAVLRVHFPLEMLISLEASPAHFLEVKETLAHVEGGFGFFVAVVAVEHLVRSRGSPVADEMADLAKLGAQCLTAVEKYNAPRAYELFLKKRAERHSWRLIKDDFLHRAIVRLCCLAGQEDTNAWSEMMKIVEGLSESEKEVLKAELGRKDGLSAPVYVLVGGGALLSAAAAEGGSAPRAAAVRLLVRLLGDAAHTFDRVINNRMVKLRLADLVARARQHGGAAALEGLPFTLEELGQGEVAVRVAGGGG